MLDMGFVPQVQSVLEYVPVERHSMCFSATWPEDVRVLAGCLLRPDHVQVRIGRNRDHCANNDVQQLIEVLPDVPAKERALLALLRAQPCSHSLFDDKAPVELVAPASAPPQGGGAVLIFCTTRDSVDRLYDMLVRSGVQRCGSTHAHVEQADREQTMIDFRRGAVQVLVATDLVARGLDIPGISLVVNFEPPHSSQPEDYVHRIGRTGRAGRQGCSVTYLTPLEANQAQAIVEVLRRAGQTPGPELAELASRAKGTSKNRRFAQRQEYLARKRDELGACGAIAGEGFADMKPEAAAQGPVSPVICCRRRVPTVPEVGYVPVPAVGAQPVQ